MNASGLIERKEKYRASRIEVISIQGAPSLSSFAPFSIGKSRVHDKEDQKLLGKHEVTLTSREASVSYSDSNFPVEASKPLKNSLGLNCMSSHARHFALHQLLPRQLARFHQPSASRCMIQARPYRPIRHQPDIPAWDLISITHSLRLPLEREDQMPSVAAYLRILMFTLYKRSCGQLHPQLNVAIPM